ncbi:helix-turn-helix transcriptional regulator [Halorubrum sp. Atlit-26R]|uniref:ArsR/SmtB family transcription factor n=1 Tax=Halorubrum sp. Atlit-26R TaxID=2282128 RepID=UPI000EF22934|nr:metalloregulator ArsR/SmtB family transcription factor [Halorubrum sp. Atlit-26R]RLM62985.1 ArsR family transcriptional regulator [Halorubrum sp. Atlit-26R]
MSESTVTDESAEGADACCVPLADIDSEALAADLQLLTAMGNDTRYELLRYVANADDGVCVCDLQDAVGVSQSAVSQALSRLYTAGLVTRRKEGSWRYYEPTETAAALLGTLDDLRGANE